MGKKTVYKGELSGTATSYYANNLVIKLDNVIEGIPEEIVVYPEFMASMSPGAGFKVMGKMKRLVAFTAKPGDVIMVEGELVLENDGGLDYYRMPCKHIYNKTLKVGF